jgi:hypothetical protein
VAIVTTAPIEHVLVDGAQRPAEVRSRSVDGLRVVEQIVRVAPGEHRVEVCFAGELAMQFVVWAFSGRTSTLVTVPRVDGRMEIQQYVLPSPVSALEELAPLPAPGMGRGTILAATGGLAVALLLMLGRLLRAAPAAKPGSGESATMSGGGAKCSTRSSALGSSRSSAP